MTICKELKECPVCKGVATSYTMRNHTEIRECWRCGSKTLIQNKEKNKNSIVILKQGYGVFYLSYNDEVTVLEKPIPIYQLITDDMIEEFREFIMERMASPHTSFLAKWDDNQQTILVGKVPMKDTGLSRYVIEDFPALFPAK